MDKFSYYNKNNLLKWFALFLSGIFTLLFILIFFTVREKGEYIYEYLIPILGFLLIFINLFNKMFLTKIYVTDNYIQYKSLFTNKKIKKKNVKGVNLIKKPRRRSPVYLPMENRPEVNFGKYYLIIRKTHERPDDLLMFLFDDNYITIEYRDNVYDSLVKHRYITDYEYVLKS